MDLSLESLKLADKQFHQNDLRRRFVNADATRLPFADETFDQMRSNESGASGDQNRWHILNICFVCWQWLELRQDLQDLQDGWQSKQNGKEEIGGASGD